MDRIFEPRGFFTVPDGTEVSPFLNATDINQDDVPWGVLGEMSVAAGRIKPGASSWVHMHPVVSQITYVTSGRLTVRMKDPDIVKPYDKVLQKGQAVITEPSTLFQLRNASDEVATILYIVSPSYVFEMVDGKVVYDDAVLMAETWEKLDAANYELPALKIARDEAIAAREDSKRRLAARKGIRLGPLAK